MSTQQGSTGPSQPLLTTEEAAQWLGFSPRMLEKRRHRGEGPPFVRISARAVRYRPEDLAEWVEDRTENTAA